MPKKCVNGFTLSPVDIVGDTCVAYKVVALAGYAPDWAAYRGPTSWSDDEVVEGGDKISKEAAEALFYAFKNSGRAYRS